MKTLRCRHAVVLLTALLASGCRRDKDAPRATPLASATASLSMTASASASASASTSASPGAASVALPATLDAGRDTDVDVKDRSALAAWVKAREAAATGGSLATAELVRVPLVRRGPGWGCICPEYFVSESTIAPGDHAIWIEPVFAPSAPAIAPETIVVVEGYFTGKATPFAPKTEEPYEKATLHELRVLRHRPVVRDPNAEGFDIPADQARARVLLEAKDAHREKEAPPDGKVFLLVALSVPMSDAKAIATAERRRTELVAKGFADAEVIDTRLVPGLFCCHLAVVASRHTTASDAEDAVKQAKKKGVALIMRRGW